MADKEIVLNIKYKAGAKKISEGKFSVGTKRRPSIKVTRVLRRSIGCAPGQMGS